MTIKAANTAKQAIEKKELGILRWVCHRHGTEQKAWTCECRDNSQKMLFYWLQHTKSWHWWNRTCSSRARVWATLSNASNRLWNYMEGCHGSCQVLFWGKRLCWKPDGSNGPEGSSSPPELSLGVGSDSMCELLRLSESRLHMCSKQFVRAVCKRFEGMLCTSYNWNRCCKDSIDSPNSGVPEMFGISWPFRMAIKLWCNCRAAS